MSPRLRHAFIGPLVLVKEGLRVEPEVQQGVAARPKYVCTNCLLLPLTDGLPTAIGHLQYLEIIKDRLKMGLSAAQTKVHRLCNINEALMFSTARHAVRRRSSACNPHVRPNPENHVVIQSDGCSTSSKPT